MSNLLFYNSSSGEGATARLDSAGTYTFVKAIEGFSKGWTHIAGTFSGGVLFYNAASGEGATAVVRAGDYTFVGAIEGFSKGWTHIASSNAGSLLFYNAASGEGATARLDSAGTGTYTFTTA